MKQLPLKIPRHEQLEEGFKEWLSLLGYAESTTYNLPHHLRELLHWLEQGKLDLKMLTPNHIKKYYDYLQHRTRQRTPGTLSNNYLQKHQQSIRLFINYLQITEQENIELPSTLPRSKIPIPTVLSKAEIQELYAVCSKDTLGQRDQIILHMHYGCGLRRTEAFSLDIGDVIKEKHLLYVRKGKAGKERYVPIPYEIEQDLTDYVNQGRKELLKNTKENALFINTRGKRLSGQSLQLRLKKLIYQTTITKTISLHTLRHSIATHLHQSGMKLEDIALFLGHKSLESTQLYTHLKEEE